MYIRHIIVITMTLKSVIIHPFATLFYFSHLKCDNDYDDNNNDDDDDDDDDNETMTTKITTTHIFFWLYTTVSSTNVFSFQVGKSTSRLTVIYFAFEYCHIFARKKILCTAIIFSTSLLS